MSIFKVFLVIVALASLGMFDKLLRGDNVDPALKKTFAGVLKYAFIFGVIEIFLVYFSVFSIKQLIPYFFTTKLAKYLIGLFFLPLTAQVYIYQQYVDRIDFSSLSLGIEILVILQAIMVYLTGDGQSIVLFKSLSHQIASIPQWILSSAFIFLILSLLIAKIFDKAYRSDY